jgi:hypothetical protein
MLLLYCFSRIYERSQNEEEKLNFVFFHVNISVSLSVSIIQGTDYSSLQHTAETLKRVLVCVNGLDGGSHGLNLIGGLVRNLNVELVLEGHDDFDLVQRVESERR